MKNSCWDLGFLSSLAESLSCAQVFMVPSKTPVRDRNMKQGEEGGWNLQSPHILALPSSLTGWLGVMSGRGLLDPCEMGCLIW